MRHKILKFDNTNHDKVKTRESSTIEFKESFNWNARYTYSKIIASFANNKGGFIIFGITDSPREIVGLANDTFENFDETTIAGFLNSCFSPEISFKKYTELINSKNIGYLQICEAKNKPIVCLKNSKGIKDISESDIYYRYNSRSEKIKYPEIVALLDETRENEQKKWANILKDIARIGSNAIISPTTDIDNQVEICITDDSNANLTRVDDEEFLKNYPLDYQSLISELKKRYTNFTQTKKFHDIKKSLISDKNLCKIRYLDPINKKGSPKKYYSRNILKKFDKHYDK